MLPLRCATVSFLFSLTSRQEDEGQILIPALTQWSFHSAASRLKQLISPGLLSFCQLLISGLPHLSRLQPLNLRLLPSQPRSRSAHEAGHARQSQARPEEGASLLTQRAAVLISDGSERRFCAAAAQPREAVLSTEIKWLLVSVNHSRNP